MQYLYERFSPDRFQEFCQALLPQEFPDIQCYPIGQADGGRDAVSVESSGASKIFQVKFRREIRSDDDPAGLVISAVKGELQKIERLASLGAGSYVIMTNLQGTGSFGNGSMDRAQRWLDENLPIPATVWWRSDLDARVNHSYELRWTFSELLTGQDVFRTLIEGAFSEGDKRRATAITSYVADQYEQDEHVKFKQANLRASDLLALFIDVPLVAHSGARDISEKSEGHAAVWRYGALAAAIQRIATEADESAGFSFPIPHPIGGARLLLDAAGQQALARVVIEGAPGQGKSTLTQYVCQVHRMKILGKQEELNRLPGSHSAGPVRVPMKVDLRDLASWLRRENPFAEGASLPRDMSVTLESFLAAQVSYGAGGAKFDTSDLHVYLSKVPCLIALDGLDEVANIADRQAVIDAVTAGAKRLEAIAASLQIVVTSRPAATAATPRFVKNSWIYASLGDIGDELIYEYIDKWCAVNSIRGREIAEIRRILKLKLPSAHIRELSKNAMQLTILLSLVHTRGQSLPDQRTNLYDSYIEIFFNREADKDETVREFRGLLLSIHGYLAWRIHAASESRRSNGRVTEQDLKAMIVKYLTSRGFDPTLLDKLFHGTVQRILALVSRVEGTFEFEVQPLREFFAARHLYDTSPYSPPGNPGRGTKPEIFQTISPNSFWLNVTRFYAGCYSMGELSGLADQIIDLLEQDDLSLTAYPRVLSTALIMDRVFDQDPRVLSRLLAKTLGKLTARLAFSSAPFGSSTMLALPDGGGGSQVMEFLLGRMMAQLPNAVCAEAAILLRGSFGPQSALDIWRSAQPSESGDQSPEMRRWLQVGGYLGVLGQLGAEESRHFAGISSSCWEILVSGRNPYAVETEQQQWKVMDRVADGRIVMGPGLGEFWELVQGVSLPALEIAAFHGHHGLLMGGEGGGTGPSLLLDDVREFSEYVRSSLFAEDRVGFGERTSRLLSLLPRRYESSWLAWRMAFLLSREPWSLSPLPGMSAQVTAGRVTEMVQRRSAPRWWSHCLDSIDRTDSAAIRGVAAGLILHASFKCLQENVAQLSGLLEGLDVDELGTLCDVIGWDRRIHRESSSISLRNLKSILPDLGPSLALCLLDRVTREGRVKLLESLHSENWRVSRGVGEKLAQVLHEEIPRNADDETWKKYIGESRRLHLQRTSAPTSIIGFPYYQHSGMPLEIARMVLRNCDDYPGVIIGIADVVVSSAAQRRIHSVNRVARAGLWAAG